MTKETSGNYQGGSALSTASVSEQRFRQNERAQLLEISRNLIPGPSGERESIPLAWVAANPE